MILLLEIEYSSDYSREMSVRLATGGAGTEGHKG